MNIQDFSWLSQGKIKRPMLENDITIASPIEIRSEARQRAILLLHGFASTPGVFRFIIPHLKKYDGIFAPALPGHADSLASFATTTEKDWLDYTALFCKNLSQEYEQVDILGLSLGGLLAYELSQRVTIRRLYLLAPAFFLRLPLRPTLIATHLLRKIGIVRIKNYGGDICNSSHPELSYTYLPLHAITSILRLIQTYHVSPPTCPIDLFLGHYDKVVDNTRLEKLFAPQSLTTIHRLSASAHILPLDNDLKAIIQTLQNNF